jgi:organic radical activating enzyme|tara:strand:- start:19782 stop:20693 length:912 start_codon:yes stop_codon:yes gene_type:complete
MKLTYKDPAKNNWFLVSWTLSNKCNYRCEYCPDILHNGSTGQPQWSTVKRFVQNFNLKDKKICYRLSGGEPTYWKHFIDLAELVKEEGHKFTFVSNGSQSPEYFKKIAPYTDGMMLSYHKAYANPEHFIKIINESKIETVINMMLLPSDFEEIFALAEKIYSSTARASIVPKVIVDKTSSENITNEVMTYTEAQKQLIKDWPFSRKVNDEELHRGAMMLNDEVVNANDLILQDKNKFSGWNCWAGLHGVNIDMWGNMYRADCQFGGAIGNLERYKLPKEKILCGKERCSCLSDIYIRKENEKV